MTEPRGKGKVSEDGKVTQRLRPVKDLHRHLAQYEIVVEVHTGQVTRFLVCECGQRVIVWRGRIEGFHKPDGEM